MEMTVREAR